MPEVAKGYERREEICRLQDHSTAVEHHTAVVRGRSVNAVRDLKTTGGPNIAVPGSGSIAAQLGEAGLVDEYQFVVLVCNRALRPANPPT
jgi:dihydrofolate reductase